MRLQKAPNGLLGAFDMKVEGVNPSNFAEIIAPTYDVADHYLALNQQVQRVQTTIANPATFGSATLRVPQGSAWFVLATSFAAVLDAADAALTTITDVRVSSDPLNTVIALIPPSEPMARGGASNRACKAAAYYGRKLYLPSGWGLLGTVQLSAAPAVSFVYDFAALVQVIPE